MMQFADIINLLQIHSISIINIIILNNNIFGPLWKGGFQQHHQQQQQTLANNSAGSICCSNCCYVYPSVLWSILFLFISTANLQFAVVTRKAKAAQGKKALECRGSPLANAKEFFVKSEEERHPVTAT
ncbi:MAG: hypothetical protein M3136_04415 [Thermoproteota archaeon]|nr:hypothetical protein [Thermoproteota archaeon]